MVAFSIKFSLIFFCAIVLYGLIHVLLTVMPKQDSDLIFAEGTLVSVESLKQVFKWPEAPAYEKKWPYKTWRVWNVDRCLCDGKEVDVPANERLIYFFVLGNKSDKMQAQPILNTLHVFLQNIIKREKTVCI